MAPIFLTQVCVFHLKKNVLFLLTITLIYTVLPLNHQYFPKYSETSQ